jgi:membrane protein YdbS with pleckstrin-like domain
MDDTSPAAAGSAATEETDDPAAGSRAVEPPASAAELGDRQLDPRFIPFQRAVGWMVTTSISACTLVAAAIFWLSADLTAWAGALLIVGWAILSVGSGWLSYAWPPIHYRHTAYRLDDEGIEIRTGVWWRQIVSVPRSRVQHIDVSQGPMERSYGLGRLVLYTAGTDYSRVELPGLNYDVAFSLRQRLLPRNSDDAV